MSTAKSTKTAPAASPAAVIPPETLRTVAEGAQGEVTAPPVKVGAPDPAPAVAEVPAPNARALRRVEHDGTAYGPNEADELLTLSGKQLDELVSINAVERI